MQKVYFICFSGMPTSYMRGEQIVSKLNSLGFLVETRPSYKIDDIKNSICVIVKFISRFKIDKLKANGNTIIWDVVDGYDVKQIKKYASIVDKIIVCSHTRNSEIKKIFNGQSICIHHHWDYHIDNIPSHDSFSFCYLGDTRLGNCLYFNELKFPVIPVRKIDRTFNWIEIAKAYNCHYSVRNNKAYRFKPSTKLSTAAAFDSNIICTMEESFSDFLDDNYPYLCSNNTLEEITNKIKFAKETFKTDIWYLGLEYMRNIKIKTDINMIINSYIGLLYE